MRGTPHSRVPSLGLLLSVAAIACLASLALNAQDHLAPAMRAKLQVPKA